MAPKSFPTQQASSENPSSVTIEAALQDAVRGGVADHGIATKTATAYTTKTTLFPPQTCILGIHDDAFSKEDVLVNDSIFPSWNVSAGTRMRIVAYEVDSPRHALKRNPSSGGHSRGSRRMSAKRQDSKPPVEISYVFVVQDISPELLTRHPNLEISINQRIATSLGFKNRCQITVTKVDERAFTASHVEIAFRDAYLTRADMWRLLVSELAGKSMYKGQKLLFMSTIKAQVKAIYDRGNKRQSAFFGVETKPIFRSESARYVLFIQMSREMWDFDADGTGEIMFHKVINGFLPELFQRWQDIGAHHLVSIILFTRMEYEQPLSTSLDPQEKDDDEDPTMNYSTDKLPYKDFYRVLVSDMASGQWAAILNQLKKDFKTFLRDVSIRTTSAADKIFIGQEGLGAISKSATKEVISGTPTSASQGNILEAINVASSQFSGDYIDRDLVRTGLSIIVVTPGTGVFEVDYNLLSLTTDVLIENGIGIDLVCLSRMPLHSVPLFKYKRPTDEKISEVSELKGENPAMTVTMAASFGSVQSYGSISRVSRSPSAENLSRTANSALFGNKDPWHYGVPHWVDVSFWTSSNESTKDGAPNSRSVIVSAQKPFVPRVRMYEVQMMGIMENEMSNISIPYLKNASVNTRSNILSGSRPSRAQASISSTNSSFMRDHHTLTPAERSDIAFSRSPSPSRLNNLKSFSSFFQWIDDYDDAVFKHPLQHSRQATLGSKSRRTKTRQTSQQVGESMDKQSFKSNASTVTEKHRESDQTSKGAQRPSARLTHKSSTSSTLSRSQLSISKPSKLSRQISFGFRGFGGAVPKAIPLAEISSETAVSESLLTRSIRASTPQTKQANSTAPSISSQDNLNLRVLELPNDKQSQPLTSDSDQASKPIPIKPGSRDTNLARSTIPTEQANYENFMLLQEKLPGMKDEIEPSSVVYGLSPRKAMAPWLTLLNPWNPSSSTMDPDKRLGRWHHVFPRPLHASNIKWKSLCSPASVPLTTEDFPTPEQLKSEYEEKEYAIILPDDHRQSEEKEPDKSLKRELISARFSHGFQIVTSNRLAQHFSLPPVEKFTIFNDDDISRPGSKVFMMRGSNIHQLSTIENGNIEIKIYQRRPAADTTLEGNRSFRVYRPAVRTTLSDVYASREVTIASARENYDWQRLDQFIAGHEEQQNSSYPSLLNFWRTRYVLIPIERLEQNGTRSMMSSSDEDKDNEEEIRLEGIKKLTQMWQKHRYVPPEERRFESTTRKKQDNNPLDIIYRTLKPSAIVAAEASILETGGGENKPAQLLPDSDLYERSNLKLASLAKTIQSEKGVKIMNRRWHLRLHPNCFIGMEFTTWLLNSFRDVDSREEATELGNELMEAGLFVHVERRHNFRDGNFFYQIADSYLVRKENRGSWFARSVPSTPIADNSRVSSSGVPSRTGLNDAHNTDADDPMSADKHKLTAALSKSLIYDVDHRHRSYRQELITLHYDRIASVDNCYHLRIDWMNVTPKLIEDTIANWALLAERNGLRLVELPIAEASKVNGFHPFRGPYVVKPALPPPETYPQNYFDASAPSPRLPPTLSSLRNSFTANKYLYQEAILKRYNFVLDLEAAMDFPPSVKVSYSWGQPDYQYPQYIHRSGVLLAQITADGSFLLLANRLYNKRSAGGGAAHHFQPPSRPFQQQQQNRNSALHLPVDESGASETTQHHQAWGGGTFTSPRASPRSSPMVRAISDIGSVGGPNVTASGLSAAAAAHAATSRSSSTHRNTNAGGGRAADGDTLVTPESIKDELERFCADRNALERFYQEVWGRVGGGLVTPGLAGVEEVGEGAGEGPGLEPVSVLSLGGDADSGDVREARQSYSRAGREEGDDEDGGNGGEGRKTPRQKSRATTPAQSPLRNRRERAGSIAGLAGLVMERMDGGGRGPATGRDS